MPTTGEAGQAARKGRRDAEPWIGRAARVGFAVNGVLHLLIGWIAAQIALGGSAGSADASGALGAIAAQPLGVVLLWMGVVGFLALALLNVVEALLGGGLAAGDRAKAGGKAVVYVALAVSALGAIRGGSSSSGEQTSDVTATLLEAPFGVVLVVGLGLAVVGIGGYHVHKGVTRRFLDDLSGSGGGDLGRVIRWLGTVGYTAKGLALGVVGALFVSAGVTNDPEESTGLDGALRTLAEQPAGTAALLAVAGGFVAYGVYSFARARYART